MREIKFRAWDKNHQMYEGTENCAFMIDLARKNSEIVLMQYTGLKDKNGKEIYEGDICSGHSDGDGKIVWNDFEWVYQFEGEDIVGIWEVRSDLKIVGNIYENPELLAPSVT